MTEKPKRDAIPQSVRFNVLRRDNFTCRYCGRVSPEVVLHIDHAMPVAAGGKNGEENLITSCQDCNYGKGAKTEVSPPVLPGVTASPHAGLLGMFGHTLNDDGSINWQFHVARQIGDNYALQLFSWMSGEPTEIVIRPAVELCGDGYRFYLDKEVWMEAGLRMFSERYSRVRRGR